MARASRTSCRDGSYQLWTFEISERVSRASALFALRPRAGSLRIAVRSLSWHSYVAIRCARRSSLRGHSPAFPVRDLERAGASRPQLVARADWRAAAEIRAQRSRVWVSGGRGDGSSQGLTSERIGSARMTTDLRTSPRFKVTQREVSAPKRIRRLDRRARCKPATDN